MDAGLYQRGGATVDGGDSDKAMAITIKPRGTRLSFLARRFFQTVPHD